MKRILTGLSVLACAAAVLAVPGTAHAAARCPLPVFGPGASYHPDISHFTPRSARVTNPLFPLPPGTTWIYTGIKDGKRAVDVVTASRRTLVIGGVRTRVVHDRLFLAGTLEERTEDYYAQDRCGNVWYFGEDTAELDAAGHVTSTEGSFRAGAGGAQPGVFMQRHPQIGRVFRQEWSPGQAEDRFRALSLHGGRLVTEEKTALEPGVTDRKAYVRGTGEVLEVTVRGGNESLRLVAVLR
jgi:hypothetical protein